MFWLLLLLVLSLHTFVIFLAFNAGYKIAKKKLKDILLGYVIYDEYDCIKTPLTEDEWELHKHGWNGSLQLALLYGWDVYI